jgi:hypothetical protein
MSDNDALRPNQKKEEAAWALSNQINLLIFS